MDFEFETTRTGLANAFAEAGAELLNYMGASATQAAIPDTQPQKYAIAGTLPGILKMAGQMMGEDAAEKPTGDLTDEQIDALWREAVNGDHGDVTQAYVRWFARAAIAAHQSQQAGQPAASKITDGESARSYLAAWHREHFPTDRTFTNYIMGRNRHCALAGDFAWQLAKALEAMEAAPSSQEGAHAARNEVLEEAALAAKRVQDEYRESQSGKWPELRDDAETGAGDCVTAIRALQTPAIAERSGEHE